MVIEQEINIILCIYNRLFNFDKQMMSIEKQTVSNKIHLHLINNNNNNKINDILEKKVQFYQKRKIIGKI